jgi:predicted MFS family arabinose efflux permease
VAVGQLGYLIGLVPLGDMLDRGRLIAAHLGLVTVGLAVTAAAPVAWVAFGGLAVAGVFAVVVQTVVAYTASISPSDERGRNLGVVTSGVVVGILGARIVTAGLADLWGWRASYLALAVLLGSWLAIGQLGWSLPLLVLGVIVLDFAVQAVHVSNQHVLTTTYADRTSSTIGGYMVFYALGSALGATATTATFDAAGWTGPTILGAALALCALTTWALTDHTTNRRGHRTHCPVGTG